MSWNLGEPHGRKRRPSKLFSGSLASSSLHQDRTAGRGCFGLALCFQYVTGLNMLSPGFFEAVSRRVIPANRFTTRRLASLTAPLRLARSASRRCPARPHPPWRGSPGPAAPAVQPRFAAPPKTARPATHNAAAKSKRGGTSRSQSIRERPIFPNRLPEHFPHKAGELGASVWSA